MGLLQKFTGEEDHSETLLEEEHDMSPSDLFVQDRRGDVKYNKEVILDSELKRNVNKCRDEDRIEMLSSRFQEHIQIQGDRMEVDMDSAEELYQDIVSHDDDVNYLSEERSKEAAAQSSYDASAAIEKAIRGSIHSNMDQIIYHSESDGEVSNTPVSATVPEAMHGFTEQFNQDSVPEGWSVGMAAAVADRYHVKESMKEKLRDESGSSIDAVINQDQNADIDIDSVIGKDPYAQDKLEELGYSDREVDSEYSLAR